MRYVSLQFQLYVNCSAKLWEVLLLMVAMQLVSEQAFSSAASYSSPSN